ncbi:MAG: slipin family protein, partial [Solirubrobacteraceae bacterium]
QLRNLQTLVEVAVDKNSTVVFPAPLMSTIAELGAFLERETKAAGELTAPHPTTGSATGQLVPPSTNGELVAS